MIAGNREGRGREAVETSLHRVEFRFRALIGEVAGHHYEIELPGVDFVGRFFQLGFVVIVRRNMQIGQHGEAGGPCRRQKYQNAHPDLNRPPHRRHIILRFSELNRKPDYYSAGRDRLQAVCTRFTKESPPCSTIVQTLPGCCWKKPEKRLYWEQIGKLPVIFGTEPS
ncbi:hypothetical protein SDC9_101799 [bioreactor metagenome]|uniref:Uncharacterized protein n=1 Tax=bioreactor metagenome TaxID=1076179 RepID=A0A645AZS7_9ZZZZ